MHACLALGFQGMHRTARAAPRALQRIQRDLYETLRRVKREADARSVAALAGAGLASRRLRVRGSGLGGRTSVAGAACCSAVLSRCGSCSAATPKRRRARAAGAASRPTRSRSTRRIIAPPPPHRRRRRPTGRPSCERIRNALAARSSAGSMTASRPATRSSSASATCPVRVRRGRRAGSVQAGRGQRSPRRWTRSRATSTSSAIPTMCRSRPCAFRRTSTCRSSAPRRSRRCSSRALAEPDRVEVDGKGADVPIAATRRRKGARKNRRVEIMIPRSELSARAVMIRAKHAPIKQDTAPASCCMASGSASLSARRLSRAAR